MLFDSTKEPKFERHIVMRNTGTIRVVWYDSDPIVTPIVEIPDYPTLKTVQILAFFISAGTMSSPPFDSPQFKERNKQSIQAETST